MSCALVPCDSRFTPLDVSDKLYVSLERFPFCWGINSERHSMPLSAIEFVEASATHRQSITLVQVNIAPDAALKSEALEKKLFDFFASLAGRGICTKPIH